MIATSIRTWATCFVLLCLVFCFPLSAKTFVDFHDETTESVFEPIPNLPSEYAPGSDNVKMVRFKNPAICHRHNLDAYNCCLFFLNHLFQTKTMKHSSRYITEWIANSEDVVVIVIPELMEIFDKTEYTAYGVAFMAGSSVYAIQHGTGDEKNQFLHAFVRLLNYYDVNNKNVGKSAKLSKYLSQYEKNPEAFLQYYADLYDQYYDQVKLTQMKRFV